MKSCCVTGHRNLDAGQVDYVKAELHKETLLALKDGFTHFISGFAEGSDLFFADIVVELKTEYPGITLEAAIPYRKRLNAKDTAFQRLIKLCDKVTVNTETYSKNCFMTRNMYMVKQSERVIAVFDGRDDGGTAFTIRFGRTQGCELRIIQVEKQ